MTSWNLPPGCTDRMVDEAFGFGPDDHSGRYEILHEEDGWWTVYRKGRAVESFVSRSEALNSVLGWEREDDEAEREARDQDDDRGDWEFHRDHDQ